MSKKLYIPEDELQRVWENFKKEITFSRSQDGKFKFEVDPGSDKEKANLIFSPIAYCKMFSLVDEYSKMKDNNMSFLGKNNLIFHLIRGCVLPTRVTAAASGMSTLVATVPTPPPAPVVPSLSASVSNLKS